MAMKADDPRGVSDGEGVRAYAAVFAAIALLVLPLWYWYVVPHLRQSGHGADRGQGYTMVMTVPFAFLLTGSLTSAITRLLGLSPAGRTVETRRKVGGGKSGGGIDAVVEVNNAGWYDKPPVVVLPLTLFVMSVLFVCVPPTPWGFWCAVAGSIVFGGMTWFCLGLYSNPVLRLDDEGILGYPSGGFGLRHQFVPWGGVATYLIETSRDDLGRATKLALTFADSRGIPLLILRPMTLPMKDRERVDRFLAAMFPKVEDGVAWEL